jgi:hypothetical protein
MAKKQVLTEKARKRADSKNARRQIKTNAIFNATFDTKLATQYRDRSWSEISRLFGITDKTLQPKKPIPKDIDVYLENTKSYRKYLSETGLIGTFKMSKDFSKSVLNSKKYKEYKAAKDKADQEARDKKRETTKEKVSEAITKPDREEIWSYWSTPKTKGSKEFYMPDEFERLAEQINLSQGMDVNSHYGYAVLYYSYTKNVAVADIMNEVKVSNKFLDVYSNPFETVVKNGS